MKLLTWPYKNPLPFTGNRWSRRWRGMLANKQSWAFLEAIHAQIDPIIAARHAALSPLDGKE